MRIVLLIAVLAIGYDAVIHQGAYTRNAWNTVVGWTGTASENARQFGESVREDNKSRLN